jgi:hypothetical protein
VLPPAPLSAQPSQLNGKDADVDATSGSEAGSPERTPHYARLPSKVPIIREAPRVPVVPGVEVCLFWLSRSGSPFWPPRSGKSCVLHRRA